MGITDNHISGPAARETVEAARHVAVIGAGIIGAGWAAFFALRGLAVRVVDSNPGARDMLDAALARAEQVMKALGQVGERTTVPVLTDDLAWAVSGAAHVQEALPEKLDLKHEVYAGIEAASSPRCVIASSSSGIPPSVLQQGLRHPERLLIAHPCNPPYLMPLVEICGGQHTAPWALDEAEAFYQGLGKQTVRLRREITGHLVNRLQSALWREAVYLVANGYASLEDVDRTVTEGLGARWAVCGPHRIFHLSGGEEGMAGFLEKLGEPVEQWWASLGQPRLDMATRKALIDGMDQAAHGRDSVQLAQDRDDGVIAMLMAKRHGA
ncbi:hydrogenase [Allopusillimonas soli]|uniref:NAD-binding protein n=1 Tax=Allopusillimonas soli TaxID=659016 RepID=A0A853FFJ7_9BURK|nr:3-hydroxyacyl-CoA dehydrogenase NAD-binding domain-containing protein [Allopusillimonas soli]NYT38667.1 NAD-binding protein [Allopusillimonas soli]TEA71627.1 hydrogenase [Allopusillimonas soli]